MICKGLNSNGQKQVTFIGTKDKATLVANNAVRKSSLKEKSMSRGTPSGSSDSGTDSDTDGKDRHAKGNFKMNIRMW
jgi:hypothetical protein